MNNKKGTVLYTGVTNDLIRRIYEHKKKRLDGFSRRYNLNKLVYYEIFEDPENAILREKQIKDGSRDKKEDLIKSFNPSWDDLYNRLI